MPQLTYRFDHWELDGNNVGAANPYSVGMDADHSLTAVFTIKHALTIQETSGGTTDPAPGMYMATEGST